MMQKKPLLKYCWMSSMSESLVFYDQTICSVLWQMDGSDFQNTVKHLQALSVPD